MTASERTRPRPKPAHWFALHSIALALVIGFWSAPRAAYPALFHAHANALFDALGALRVHLGPGQIADTAMTVTDRARGGDAVESSFDVVRIGYWPSVLLLALLLASPLPPLRRAAAAAIGLALVDLFTLA